MELKGATAANSWSGERGKVDIQSLRGAKTPVQQRQALQRAAEEFEAIFLRQLVETMRKTVDNGGLLEKNPGEQLFEGMLDEEWARKLAGSGGSGSLSGILYRHLSRQLGLDGETSGLAAAGKGGLGDE